VRLWDAERKRCIGTGKGHLGAIGSVAFSKKSKNFFVSGSRFVVQFLCDICLPKDAKIVILKITLSFSLVIKPSRCGHGMIHLMMLMMKFLSELRLL
jgi:WD40 repeat protein